MNKEKSDLMFKIGKESLKNFKNDFDLYYDNWKKIAQTKGFNGKLHLIKANKWMYIYSEK